MKRIILLILIAVIATGCGSFGITTKGTLANALTPFTCSAENKAKVNMWLANSPLCRAGGATIQCLGLQFAADNVFRTSCPAEAIPTNNNLASRESFAPAGLFDPNAEMLSILESSGYNKTQVAMRIARLSRD